MLFTEYFDFGLNPEKDLNSHISAYSDNIEIIATDKFQLDLKIID